MYYVLFCVSLRRRPAFDLTLLQQSTLMIIHENAYQAKL